MHRIQEVCGGGVEISLKEELTFKNNILSFAMTRNKLPGEF